MGRKKKSLIEKSPFKLRHRKLADGRLSLFLDRSVDGGHEYEFLQLYLMPETSAKARRQNAQTLRKAEDIQRERTEALLNAKVGTVPESKSSDMLLSDWMTIVRKNHEHREARDLNGIDNARKNLLKFRADVRLCDVDRQFYIDYIDWLRSSCKTAWGKQITPKTAHSYYTTLRTALNEAVRERLIESNPWYKLEMTEKIKVPESKRDFLTIEEIKKMIATPFFNEQVRQAYLFSCFCGLRISDIRKLRWRDISISGGQWLVSVVMTKTTNPVYIPLSSQAVKWLPERNGCTPDGLVFGGLPNTSNLCVSLKNWADKAGINIAQPQTAVTGEKVGTFHVFAGAFRVNQNFYFVNGQVFPFGFRHLDTFCGCKCHYRVLRDNLGTDGGVECGGEITHVVRCTLG